MVLMNMSARSCARSVAKGCQDKIAIASSILFNLPCVILDKKSVYIFMILMLYQVLFHWKDFESANDQSEQLFI